MRRKVETTASTRAEPASVIWRSGNLFINAGSLMLSLVLLNLLFLVQSLLDIVYLWGGVRLPDGLTYAEYAHRGAYPLIVTALLAGLFALISRPYTHGRPVLKVLITLWLGQNVLLVVSSLLRLDLYVDAFGLTYLRVYAAIWMALVAVGLVLTLAQLWREASNRWLVGMITAVVIGTLYGASLVNIADGIARHNIARSATHPDVALDRTHLCELGPMAFGAMLDGPSTVAAMAVRGSCDTRRNAYQTDPNWRSWSWRQWQVDRAIAARA
jgi:hypothetical protein